MAIILYSNAILETIRPAGLTFTEDEMLDVFSEDYHTMHSKRILEVPNTWAVWGSMDNPPNNEYNIIGSDIVDYDIDSPLLMIHDSEINPNWKITDDVIQFGYDDFLRKISEYINEIANEVMKKKESLEENAAGSLISLVQMGITTDKKLLFSFDPNSQDKGFYEGEPFKTFSEKILEYLKTNLDSNIKQKKPFTIFDDNKTVVIVNDENIIPTLDIIMEKFQHDENYEACKDMIVIKKKVSLEQEVTEEKPKKKRGRPKKDDKK
jgi:hypothetical protein